jgi:hypothetical protein
MDGGEKTLSFEGERLARCWSGCLRGGKIEEKSWKEDEGFRVKCSFTRLLI